jgi:hypothetical protein
MKNREIRPHSSKGTAVEDGRENPGYESFESQE